MSSRHCPGWQQIVTAKQPLWPDTTIEWKASERNDSTETEARESRCGSPALGVKRSCIYSTEGI